MHKRQRSNSKSDKASSPLSAKNPKECIFIFKEFTQIVWFSTSLNLSRSLFFKRKKAFDLQVIINIIMQSNSVIMPCTHTLTQTEASTKHIYKNTIQNLTEKEFQESCKQMNHVIKIERHQDDSQNLLFLFLCQLYKSSKLLLATPCKTFRMNINII